MVHTPDRVGSGLVLGLLSLTLGDITTAQESEKLQTVNGISGKVRIQLPQEWKLEPRDKTAAITDKINGRSTVISQSVRVAGFRGLVELDVTVVNGAPANDLCAVWEDSRLWADTKTLEVLAKPFPHVLASYHGHDTVAARACCYVQGRGLHVMVRCRASEWPTLRPHLAAVVRQLKATTLEPWPGLPKDSKGRRNVTKNGVCFSFATGVSGESQREIMTCVAALQKNYTADHAPLPWTDASPFVIIVNATDEEHREFNDGEEAPTICNPQGQRRILCTPIGKPGTEFREFFVGSFYSAMMDEHYPDSKSEWMSRGEIGIARMRDTLKKPLPYATRAFLDAKPTSLPFADVKPTFAKAGFWNESLAYIALFRAGPSKYKKAYLAFLAELRETGDLERAKKTHLLSLDQKQLHKDLIMFVKRLRAPRKRREP